MSSKLPCQFCHKTPYAQKHPDCVLANCVLGWKFGLIGYPEMDPLILGYMQKGVVLCKRACFFLPSMHLLSGFYDPPLPRTLLRNWVPSEALMRRLLELMPSNLRDLAAQNRESRIARFPESRTWNRQKFRSEKQNNESNRSKGESRKIDSESPSESLLINA